VISPLRCVRIPPGTGVRTIAKVPLRRGEVDTEFDQEMLAELLDQQPFNVAMADLYKTRFNGVPGVVYAAGVRHAYNLAEAFRAAGLKAMAVSGETKKRELASILARYEAGEIDVLINAQLLAEGWNSPRATVCIHLAPTASKRIYQQRVGRVTRRHPGKEAGLVVDFVHPATKHDDPVVTLHSLLDRDVYRGGAIVVGPVRRGRGRRVRVERRVLPVCSDPDRRAEVFERELWRIAVEHLDYGEQHVWAALAGARVQPHGWRRARAMLHFDRTGELRRRFLSTAVQRNTNPQLRLKALAEIAAIRDAEAFDTAIDMMGNWTREERREGTKIMLQAMVDKRIGRRDQANAWIWRMAEYTRDVHEEYAAQRWPETKRLLGLLVNSSGAAHARNARRLVQAIRKQDRRLAAALLAAALAHTPEAEEVLRGARTRMARKPPALARELLRNFPKRRARGKRRRRRGSNGADGQLLATNGEIHSNGSAPAGEARGAVTGSSPEPVRRPIVVAGAQDRPDGLATTETSAGPLRGRSSRRGARRADQAQAGAAANGSDVDSPSGAPDAPPVGVPDPPSDEPKPRRAKPTLVVPALAPAPTPAGDPIPRPGRPARIEPDGLPPSGPAVTEPKPAAARRTSRAAKAPAAKPQVAADPVSGNGAAPAETPKPAARRSAARKAAAEKPAARRSAAGKAAVEKPAARRSAAGKAAVEKPAARRSAARTAAAEKPAARRTAPRTAAVEKPAATTATTSGDDAVTPPKPAARRRVAAKPPSGTPVAEQSATADAPADAPAAASRRASKPAAKRSAATTARVRAKASADAEAPESPEANGAGDSPATTRTRPRARKATEPEPS
jgi:hypothetical protein